MGVGRRLREILPYSHGDAQKHGHESVNNSDAQKPSIDIRHIPAFPFTNRDSAEFNLARCSPLNVTLPRSISSLAAAMLDDPRIDRGVALRCEADQQVGGARPRSYPYSPNPAESSARRQ